MYILLQIAKNISIGVGVVAVATSSAYFLAKPVILKKSEPILQEMVKKYINGTLTWDSLDLDGIGEFNFYNVQLKDSEGQDVLKSSNLKVGWSFSSVYKAFIKGEGNTAVIDNVILEKPEITIRQKADNTWNVQKIIIPQKEKSESNFNIKVKINNGEFLLKRNNKESETLKNINGYVNLKKDLKFDGKIIANYENSNVNFAFNYVNSNDMNFTISSGVLPLKNTLETLRVNGIKIPQLPIKSGNAVIKVANIIKNKNAWSYTVKGHLEKVYAKYNNFNMTDANSKFDITNGTASFENINGKINDQNIYGYFKINWSGKDTEIQSKINTKGAKIQKIVPDFDVNGILSGSVQIGGHLNNLYATGYLHVDDLNNDTFSIKEADSNVILKNNIIKLTSLKLKTNDGKAYGKASYDLNNSEFSANINLNSVNVKEVVPHKGINGVVSGNLQVIGSYAKGAKLNNALIEGSVRDFGYEKIFAKRTNLVASFIDNEWKANISGEEIAVEDITLDAFEANLTKNDEGIILHDAKGFSDNGTVAIKGNISDKDNSIDIYTYNWNLAPFSKYFGHELKGRITSQLSLSGNLKNPYISGTAEIYNGAFDKIDFQHSCGKFHTNDEAFFIDYLNIERNKEQHNVIGKIYKNDEKTLDLNVKSSGLRIENALSIFNFDYPVTGNADNEIHINGSLNNPSIEGTIHAWEGSAKGQLFENIYAKYVYSNGKLYVKNGQINAYGGVATLEGVLADNLLDINVNAVDLDLERIIPEREIRGKIGVKGHLAGNASNPEFDGVVSGRSVSLGNSNLGLLSVDVKYRNNVFLVSDGNFYQGGANFNIKGRYNIETSIISGKLNYKNWNLSDIVKVFKLPIKNIDGEVDGYIGLSGYVYDADVDFKANVNGGHLGNTAIGKGIIDVSYLNKELNIRKFSIPIGDGLLAAKGSMSSDGIFNMQFAARNMDTKWIPQVTDLDAVLDGKLTAALVLNGTRKEPQMNVSVGVENFNYNGYKFDEISIMGIIKDNIIDVQNALLMRDKYKASMKGTAPLSLVTRIPSSNEKPIDLKINLDNADMNALALFFKPVQKAEGPLKGQLKISGAWNDPHVWGDISVSNGQMTLITMKEPLSNVNLSVKFKGKSMQMNSSASVGNGNISMKGVTEWKKNKSFSYNGEFHLHAPEIKSEFYNGAVDADINFEPYEGIPNISGNVKIHDASLDIPLSMQSDSALPEVSTNLDIHIGDNVKLYNSALYNMLIVGDIRANGYLSDPFMSGRVNVEKGTIKVNTTEFRVEKGQALWGGNSGTFMPNIHVAANANVGSYKIGAQIDGIPGNLITKLHSEPYLNDSQILMLLALHQNPHASSEDSTQNAFFNAGLAMIFNGGVKDFLTDKIGLDLISVTSGVGDYYDSNSIDKNNFYYIKIGKYLFNDFMLTATGGLNNEERSIGFRYDVNSHLGVSAWYNSNHDSFIGTDWKFKF